MDHPSVVARTAHQAVLHRAHPWAHRHHGSPHTKIPPGRRKPALAGKENSHVRGISEAVQQNGSGILRHRLGPDRRDHRGDIDGVRCLSQAKTNRSRPLDDHVRSHRSHCQRGVLPDPQRLKRHPPVQLP